MILAIFWCLIHLKNVVLQEKFSVHVVISILQAFNCRYLEIFVGPRPTLHIFFSLYFKAKTQWNKGMSDFKSGNSVNCVLLDIYHYETKREKIIGPLNLKLPDSRMV